MEKAMTFRGYPVAAYDELTKCDFCGTPVLRLVKCPCGTNFCFQVCVPTASMIEGDIECPRCKLENSIIIDDLNYTESDQASQQIQQEKKKDLYLERLRQITADDVIRVANGWKWIKLKGKFMAKLTVKPEEAAERSPAAGTILSVSGQGRSNRLQVTTGGFARHNGKRIDLIVDVEDYDPQGKHKDINRKHLEEASDKSGQ